jgi:predicted house-cleaning noncanonical NTP pyrophosphatase (MazG superfamily)
MKYFKLDKLVRDKILDSMKETKQHPRGVKILNDQEYVSELIKKIIEETNEMGAAQTKDELEEEIADVQDILNNVKRVLKLSEQKIRQLQKKKIAQNGNFKKRIYIKDVGVEEDSMFYQNYNTHSEKFPVVS